MNDREGSTHVSLAERMKAAMRAARLTENGRPITETPLTRRMTAALRKVRSDPRERI